MIRYGLVCRACDHRFDAWFGSSDGFETQASRGLLACPECGAARVEKALMAPRVRTEAASRPAGLEGAGPETAGSEAARSQPARSTPLGSVPTRSTSTRSTPGEPSTPPPPGAREAVLRRVLHDMRRHADAVSEDVGRGFAQEARRIHEGEAEDRPIRGQATDKEVKALHEDGIEAFALPEIEPDA